jgi:hypothetical protein
LDIADPVTDRACHRISSKWSFPGAYLRHLRKFRLAVDVLPYWLVDRLWMLFIR